MQTQNNKPKELNEAKKEFYGDTMTIFVASKIRIKRSPEQESDFRVWKIHVEDAVRNSLLSVGEVKAVFVIT